jgi:hypothetical protein
MGITVNSTIITPVGQVEENRNLSWRLMPVKTNIANAAAINATTNVSQPRPAQYAHLDKNESAWV